ncbi:acetyl-CoA carboxylase biotin carboxyl carrier protein [Streptomyces sp. KR80]|uniref:acetyl-CoA carboxylase biotin carboxyl carrier protein n=1 Tax=Streptomyces sp. KR80 TaxID=3457426 RepID=UPI003FD63A4A
MTQDSDRTNHHEGRRLVFAGNGFTGTDLAPLAHEDLESLCRSAMSLVREAPRPPLRIKLQYGHMAVELEWPEPGLADAEAASQEPAPAARTRPAQEPPAPVRYVVAPTVGTFYHAPEPGAPPFVSVGDVVRPGQPVGLLEVMKMMSSVEADATGRVVEVLVPDGHPVEFQQRLIALEPLTDPEA